jgi:hypothetical protein
MKFHDIICEEEGWSHRVDGVHYAMFPTWYLALNAAKLSAEQDDRDGIVCSIRFQSMDGSMLPVQQRAAPASGMKFAPAGAVRQAAQTIRLAG